MNIQDAINCMKDGKKVKRANDCFTYYYKDDKICCEEAKWKYDKNYILYEDVLADDWEVAEEKKKYWRPEEEEKYFAISNKGDVLHCLNKRIDIAQAQSEIGNCFKTKIEAEHMLETLKVIHELQKFAYENNEGEIEWGNKCYYLCYDHLVGNIEISENIFFQFLPFNIYFTSRKIALKAIETIGADRIKKYYYDVEE